MVGEKEKPLPEAAGNFHRRQDIKSPSESTLTSQLRVHRRQCSGELQEALTCSFFLQTTARLQGKVLFTTLCGYDRLFLQKRPFRVNFNLPKPLVSSKNKGVLIDFMSLFSIFIYFFFYPDVEFSSIPGFGLLDIQWGSI